MRLALTHRMPFAGVPVQSINLILGGERREAREAEAKQPKGGADMRFSLMQKFFFTIESVIWQS